VTAFAYLNGQMQMVCHETKSMDTIPEPYRSLLQQEEQVASVVITEEDLLATISVQEYMVNRAGDVHPGVSLVHSDPI
jgi:hypothetical protein